MPPKPPRRPTGKPPRKGRRFGQEGGSQPRERDNFAQAKGEKRDRIAPSPGRPVNKKFVSNQHDKRGEAPRQDDGRSPPRPAHPPYDKHRDDKDRVRNRPDRTRPEGERPDMGHPGRRGPRDRAPDGGPRSRTGEGWIYGHHAVAAALVNPARRLERLVVTTEASEALVREGAGGRISPEFQTSHEISALLPDGAVHQGFALKAAPLPDKHIEDIFAGLAEGAPALVIVLDQVTDPRNVGAIMRSAAAFAAAAVILPERHGADTTAALAKAASGALETVALVRVTNISRTLEALKAGGFWCVGLDAHADQPLSAIDLSGRIALVMGSEGAGLRRLVADTCDLRAKLPISGAVESLNVSAAAAIAMYEVARRRA